MCISYKNGLYALIYLENKFLLFIIHEQLHFNLLWSYHGLNYTMHNTIIIKSWQFSWFSESMGH